MGSVIDDRIVLHLVLVYGFGFGVCRADNQKEAIHVSVQRQPPLAGPARLCENTSLEVVSE